jgi:hypothetical protein
MTSYKYIAYLHCCFEFWQNIDASKQRIDNQIDRYLLPEAWEGWIRNFDLTHRTETERHAS